MQKTNENLYPVWKQIRQHLDIDYNISAVYSIKCIVNNKIYVGSSINIRKRWSHHISFLCRNNHPNKYLQRAWNKYGYTNFVWEILEVTNDNASFNERQEKIWIDKLDSANRKLGFNLTPFTDRREFVKSHNNKVKVNSKPKYLIISPNKTIYEVSILKDFCIENHISYSGLRSVACGYRNHLRGWFCFHITNISKDLALQKVSESLILEPKSGRKYKGRKLTEDEVLEICRLYDNNVGDISSLAEQFGTSKSSIHRIVLGYTWSSLTNRKGS